MSGICSVCWSDPSRSASPSVSTLSQALSLSGVEQVSHKAIGNAGLGVAAGFPCQQIYAGERTWLACDADLTNLAELRALLGPRTGDLQLAQLLAILYERFGRAFVERLSGGFSILVWDRPARTLIAAVDHFGIKQLAMLENRLGLIIASRVDSIASVAEDRLDINPRAVASVLNSSAILGQETIFSQIRRLAPGTRIVWSGGEVKCESYWDLSYFSDGDRNEDRLSRKLEAVVQNSVSAHAEGISNAHLGAFLSGGTDSSTVVGMMSRHAPEPPNAFSIGFHEDVFNELTYAELAANAFGARHSTYLVTASDCFQALPSIVRAFDEPFGNSSAIPTYFCARLAAGKGVKILLAGDGGDELFGGNERYAIDKVFHAYHSVPESIRTRFVEPVLSRVPLGGIFNRARGYVRRANMPGVNRLLSFQFLATHDRSEVFQKDFLEQLGAYTIFDTPARHYAAAPAIDHLDKLLYVDMKITIADNDLPKVMRMVNLAGLQARFPFLSLPVAEMAGQIPANLKVKGFTKRYLFKKAFRNLLPAAIRNKKKHGFGIPVGMWLKSDPRLRELAQDTLNSASCLTRGFFRRQFIESLYHRHNTEDATYYGDTIWTLLMLELWQRQAVDRPARMAG